MAKDKKKKIMRPKAIPPKGFRDYFGTDVAERNLMLTQITEVYHRYGFDALESPAVETVEALGKFLPDVDRPNEGVFSWQDDDDAWMALRYDLTAPLARVYSQFRNDLPSLGNASYRHRGVLMLRMRQLMLHLVLQHALECHLRVRFLLQQLGFRANQEFHERRLHQ